MVEDTAPVSSVIAPAPMVESAPVTTVEAAPVVAPVAESIPVSSTVLGEALTEAPKTETSKPTTESPTTDGTKPVEEAPKAVEGQSDEPAPPPVFDAFSLPETVQLDTERVKLFTDILADLETTSKADHALVQQFGQKAVDLHIQEVQKAVSDITKFYEKTWQEQKVKWKDEFLADSEIGGNRSQTTVSSALDFIRTHGGTTEQQTEFRNLMESSGLGNHPAMIRLLANAGRHMSEGKPLAANNPLPLPKSKVDTLYGTKSK